MSTSLDKIRECYTMVEDNELDWDMEFLESLHEQLDEGRDLTTAQDQALDNVYDGITRLARGKQRE